MARPKKQEQMEFNEMPTGPIPVKVVEQERKNPLADRYPSIEDPIEKSNYRFTYNQSPGCCLEFTKNRTVLAKNGRPTFLKESFALEDGNIYELPKDVATHLNSLIYKEQGHDRPRCSCVEVD